MRTLDWTGDADQTHGSQAGATVNEVKVVAQPHVVRTGTAARPAVRGGQTQAAQPLLVLQRQIGNRAVTSLVLQRKLSIGPERIDAARSGTGRLGGKLSKDTLYRLRTVLADHQTSTDVGGAQARIAVILGLCHTYMANHGQDAGKQAGRKLSAVDDIMQAATVELSQMAAQARYAQDVYAKKTGDDTTATPMRHADMKTLKTVMAGSQTLGKGVAKPADSKTLGAGAEALDMVTRYGLTEAEILAVRVYTGADYSYINPATANAPGWMADNMLPVVDKKQPRKLTPADLKLLGQIAEEGALHGAVAVSALRKLPVQKGLCYRGERVNDATSLEITKVGAPQGKPNLTSVSLVEEKAHNFSVGNDKTRADQTVSVIWEIQVSNGRDIQPLSIYGKKEAEWLLLPGAKIVADRVVESTTGQKGFPKATRWLRVYAHQVS